MEFSKFINEDSSNDLIEIPLVSEDESDATEFYSETQQTPLIESEPLNILCTLDEPVINHSCDSSYSSPDKTLFSDRLPSFYDQVSPDIDNEELVDDLTFNEDIVKEMQHQCTLLSPSLVRAITSDIEDIKRSLGGTLASQNDVSNMQQFQKASPFKKPAQIKEMNFSKRPKNREDIYSRHLPSNSQYAAKKSAYYSRNTCQRSYFGGRNPRYPMKATIVKCNEKSSGSSSKSLTAQQWTFPVVANTAYSSSESVSDSENDGDDSVSPHNQTPGPSYPKQKIEDENIDVESHDGEWSLRREPPGNSVNENVQCSKPHRPKQIQSVKSVSAEADSTKLHRHSQKSEADYGSDDDTDQLLEKQYQSERPVEIPELKQEAELLSVKKRRGREVVLRHPDMPDRLLEGRLYPARYLGSTQLIIEDNPSKVNRLHQAKEAVNRVKAPPGENQPSVAVELFVSPERILILNKALDEIVMDHDLRLISHIADIGSTLVMMVRRPTSGQVCHAEGGESSEVAGEPSNGSGSNEITAGSPVVLPARFDRMSSKIVCHLFESDETQSISQAIGRAFQEAYFAFLREHGVDDPEAFQEHNYETVLNQQDIFRNELAFFSNKDQEKEVVIPKHKGEMLGVVVVESGWGSVLPTVVLANMHPTGPAARCGQLNIGNQLISINGQSFVGLNLGACQALIRATKNQTAVKLVIVNCPPVVEVLIRRPDEKFQLGFSVQDGVICSLLRGGIAERGGIRVDHRIIEINGESVVAVPHDYIVQLLATAVGEIYIRTMQTSIFRLLTGQDTPHYI